MTARKDGKSWVADFYHLGKRIRKYGFPTKSAAVRFEQDYHKSLLATGRPLDDRLTDLVNLWYELHGCTLKDAKTRMARTLSICTRLENPLVSEFSALHWSKYRQARLEEVTASTVNHEQRYLSSVFSELSRLGAYLGDNPLRGIRQVKVNETELSFLEVPQIRLLLDECKRSVNKSL